MHPTGDAAATSPFSPAYRLLSIGVVLQVTLMAFETLAVSTAMPVVAQDLGGIREYGLAFSLFVTANVFGVVVAGTWCDAFGPRGPARLGFALFCGGLGVCGLAPSMTVLLLGRLVAGAGCGLLIVSLYVVIAQMYPSALQPRVFGLLGAAWVLPSIVGPALAGWVAQYLTWRLVFLAVPFLTLAAVLALLPRIRGLGPAAESPVPVSWRRIGTGAVLAAGVGLFQWGLLGPAAAAVVGVVAIVVTLPLLLPPGTLRMRRGLPSAIAMRALLGGTFFAAEVFVPLMLVTQRDVAPALAGFTLTGAVVGWMVGSQVQGRLRPAFPRHVLLTGAAVLVGITLTVLSRAPFPATPVWAIVPVWAFAGLGMGLGMSTVSVMVLRLSGPAEQGRNSAGLHLAEGVGNALAIGGTGAVFAALHDPGGSDAGVFSGIWLALGLVALASALVAHRVRP